MSKYDENKQLRCSFCGKPQSQVSRLVAGPGVYICDECIHICLDILKEGLPEEETPEAEKSYKLPKPKEITEILSDYVIEQDQAKKLLRLRCTITTKGSTVKRPTIKTMLNCRKAILS